MRETYLSERIYHDTHIELNEKKKQYWMQLLGEKTVEEFLEYHHNFACYLKDEEFERKEKAEESFLSIDDQRCNNVKREIEREIKGKKIFFAEFYQSFVIRGIEELEKKMEEWKDYVSKDILKDFADELLVRLQNIALRTLIAEMHGCKQRGELCGSDSREEYLDFCRISGTKEFLSRVSETYPVLLRCLNQCVRKQLHYYEQVISWFYEDKEKIEDSFFTGRSPGKIVKMESGLSDLHNGGKEVMKISFENGNILLLKPRSMRNEQYFAELLEWIGERTGIDQYRYPILSKEDHSWCGIVEYRMCQSQAELHRYYQRIGEQLLLAYVLGTNDIHYENLIACGEYPVIIDLEALTHNANKAEDKTAEDAVRSWIGESVLSTGILPSYTWNASGEGIDGSALHSRKGQKLPFKIPTVDKGETSEMYITYREGYSSEGKNLAGMKGNEDNLAMYGEDILNGFSQAYMAVEQDKDCFIRKLEEGKGIKSRIVLMHTQRYTMLLNSSYHPSLLMDGADREIFLASVGQGRWEKQEEIVNAEINSLLNGDVPTFSFLMEEKGVYFGDHVECDRSYFHGTALGSIQERVRRFSERNRKKQEDLIRTSLDLIPENREFFSNKIYPVMEKDVYRDEGAKKRLENACAGLSERLCDYAIWNPAKTEVSWFALRFSGSGNYSWEIRPMGIYFYDGLSGLLLLTATMLQGRKNHRLEALYVALRRQIFVYTDRGIADKDNLQSRSTGAYTGESSLISVYLRLYRMTGEEIYLTYAKKHAKIVAELLPEDPCADLLGGKAGAAWVFLQMFEVTKEDVYVKLSQRAIAYLLPQAVQTSHGIGWIPENCEIPVGGMAHGNAGILIPVLWLAEITGKEEYDLLAEKIWEYEDSLYNDHMENWADVREGKGEGEDTVAWCHGAAGILLSRLWCAKMVTDPKWKERLKRDIELAYKKTEHYWKRDSWSLCHGNGGNLWILEIADRILWKTHKKRGNFGDIRLLPQERMNPGIMGGYGGVLLYLSHCIMDEDKEEKSSILI